MSYIPPKKTELTPKQLKAAKLYGRGTRIYELPPLVGVSEKRIKDWVKMPLFTEEYRKQRTIYIAEIKEQATDILSCLRVEVADTLVSILKKRNNLSGKIALKLADTLGMIEKQEELPNETIEVGLTILEKPPENPI